MKKDTKNDNKFFMYKGKPLVRCGDTIYYGSMKDDYVIKINIKSSKKLDDIDISEETSIQLISTDPDISLRKKIVKTSKKNGLYLSLDIADIWLERALAQ